MKKGNGRGQSQQQSSKKDCKKRGRNLAKCGDYKASHQRELNKLRNIVVELERNPNNQSARQALERYRAELGL